MNKYFKSVLRTRNVARAIRRCFFSCSKFISEESWQPEFQPISNSALAASIPSLLSSENAQPTSRSTYSPPYSPTKCLESRSNLHQPTRSLVLYVPILVLNPRWQKPVLIIPACFLNNVLDDETLGSEFNSLGRRSWYCCAFCTSTSPPISFRTRLMMN